MGDGSGAGKVGGARQVANRRSGAVATANSGRRAAGNAGIMKFYTDDSTGLKVSPTAVLVVFGVHGDRMLIAYLGQVPQQLKFRAGLQLFASATQPLPNHG